MSFDVLVTGGTIVTPDGLSRRDVAINDGRIAALPETGSATAARVVDATGRHIFPGLIDAHVHFGFGEPVTEYTTETIYAAQGGFTTILGYFLNNEPYGGVFERELALAETRSVVDYGFHFSTASPLHIDELDRYVRDYGVTSFKYFANFKGEEGRYLGLDGTDDSYLYALLDKAAGLGDVTVVVHTENIELVNAFRRRAMETGMATLKDWASVKPAFTEAEACVRAMMFAEHLGATIYVPHISTRLALDEVRRWRRRYDRVFVETCPHYLTHTEDSNLGGLGKANPPFRSADDVAAMWEGLADGSIDVVASDHVPRKRATKEVGLWQASQGFPGTATILPVLLDRGYHQGRLSLERIAALLCRRPAELFQLPMKGRIEPGMDGDLTIVDLHRVRVVDPAKLGSYADYSLYEGESFTGWPVEAILRGQTIMRDGAILAPGGWQLHREARDMIRRGFVDIGDGRQVHYRTAGSGGPRPLVVLHPSPGSAKMMEPLIAACAETRAVYGLDTLGNGDSSPPGVPAPDIAHFAAAHRAAIDALGIGEFDLHGSHTGATIAAEIAIAWPDRVRHLVLDGVSNFTEAERADMLAHHAPPLTIAPDAGHLLWAWNFVRDGFLFWPWYKRDRAHLRGIEVPGTDAIHDKVVEVIKAARSFHLSYNASIAYDKAERMGLVAVPTLLACAKEDMLLTYLDEIAALMPHAERYVSNGLTDETIAHFTGFLDS